MTRFLLLSLALLAWGVPCAWGEPKRGLLPTESVHFSSDGKRVVILGDGCEVRDASTGRRLLRIPFQEDVRSADVDPAGSRLAYVHGQFGCSLEAWDLRSGARVTTWDIPTTFIPEHVALFPDGRRVALSTKETTWLWALDRSLPTVEISGSLATVSPDGRTVATVNSRGGLYFYDVTGPVKAIATWFDGEVPRSDPLGAPPSQALALCFSPDGRLLAQRRAWDTRIQDLASGQVVAVLPGKAVISRSQFVRFRADGKKVATDFGAFVRVWDVTSGRPESLVPVLPNRYGEAHGGTADFSADGLVLGISQAFGNCVLWSFSSQTPCALWWGRWQPPDEEDTASTRRARVTTVLPPTIGIGRCTLNRAWQEKLERLLGPDNSSAGPLTWYHAPSGTVLEVNSKFTAFVSLTLYRTCKAPPRGAFTRTKFPLMSLASHRGIRLGMTNATVRRLLGRAAVNSERVSCSGIAAPDDPTPMQLSLLFERGVVVRMRVALAGTPW